MKAAGTVSVNSVKSTLVIPRDATERLKVDNIDECDPLRS